MISVEKIPNYDKYDNIVFLDMTETNMFLSMCRRVSLFS